MSSRFNVYRLSIQRIPTETRSMAAKPYRAKSISGAQSFVRRLLRLLEQHKGFEQDLIGQRDQARAERRLMAMLAAEGPCFSSPITVAEAKKVRDQILASECNLNPDGTYRVKMA